jgi:glycosyltransferase involved in cell wall biosynthesis
MIIELILFWQQGELPHLIKIWNLIPNRHNNWELHIYGEGDENLKFKLQKLINTLKLPNIFFKGATNKLDLKMKNASIFALTSETECFPMVLLESLSCGLPVISYDCPNGPRNIITNNKDGILIKSDNIKCFAKELENMIKNFELRKEMSRNAIKNVRRFDESIVMESWIKLFLKISKDN